MIQNNNFYKFVHARNMCGAFKQFSYYTTLISFSLKLKLFLTEELLFEYYFILSESNNKHYRYDICLISLQK